MILARLSNGKNESSTKLVDRVKTVAFIIILFRFCPYCDCNYIGARLWSSGLESKAANDAIFLLKHQAKINFEGIKQR